MNTPIIREILTQSLYFIKPRDTEPEETKLIEMSSFFFFFLFNMFEVLMRVFDAPLDSISDFFKPT